MELVIIRMNKEAFDWYIWMEDYFPPRIGHLSKSISKLLDSI